ncbi:hypothetical protein [Wukongibacter sp. M2B1]|uniref:hypothetical protein n=1 Tax=Wukongibacter sp. M2B1 TaxID=3088895 RepID=UPI003D7A5D3B
MDVNNDSKLDIVVLAEYITGSGREGTMPQSALGLYINRDGTFINNKKMCDDMFMKDVTDIRDIKPQ